MMVKKASRSFLKKRTKKLFSPFGVAYLAQARRKQTKVFWFFFSKKNAYLSYPQPQYFAHRNT
jgi:hypothetical protein